jgi:hypothetical protein
MGYTLKQIVGAAVLDLPHFEWRLRSSWLRIRNRKERLRESADGRGVACEWQWTSDLHAPKVFPGLGLRLMARCFRDWPIEFASAPRDGGGEVQVSFVIGHRGLERVPQLLSTLATIAAQHGVVCECIVVEQSMRSEVADLLPSWVRYVHTPLPAAGMPYCRSWTLNVGARAARGKVLVLHDNDMLIPQAYASELWARSQEGYEVINLKRFIFYLTEPHSGAICAGDRRLLDLPAEAIVQNLEAGGSVAVARDAFFAIGGYDEAFVGWGGEDNEFWQRALTRKVWPYAYLPIAHLWHAPQPGKQQKDAPAVRRFQELAGVAPERRIADLAQRKFGDAQRMDPPWQPGAS